MKHKSYAIVTLLLSFASAKQASAQQAPDRDDSWAKVSTVSLLVGVGTEVLMPRVFYSDPEATIGWKARWHVSVLAPALSLTSLAVLNEYALKDKFEGYRPECSKENQGGPGCKTYGMMSTHAFGAFAALGQGGAVFLFDTLKWSGSRFNAGSFVGHVAVPLVSAIITGAARKASNWEDSGQILAGGGAGLATGFLTGTVYALMQRPECGYSGSMICW